MRTTLTLDDDIAAVLDQLRRQRRASLKDLVNEALREGLKRMRTPSERGEAFRTGAVSLGALRIGSIDNIAEALAVAEGEAFR
jgi:Ribbon-helix-helix protein, copG family